MSTMNNYKLRSLPPEKFVPAIERVLDGTDRYRTIDGRVIDLSNYTERKAKDKKYAVH